MHSSLSEIKAEVLGRIRPRPEERERLKEISGRILLGAERLAAERGIDLKAMLVGSAARNTWLAQDHDLDLFLGVPESADLGEALEVARLIAPEHEEKYAEHAYVHAKIDGFDVDLVPCYLVKDASRLKSAVDRTPFHTKYVSERIPGLEDEVLLAKQFMKGVGVYGSELKVGGFSGYLTELLIIYYGSFEKVLEAASGWRPGVLIDLEGRTAEERAAYTGREPLIVVDPVDPGRNVAAALTPDRMLQFAAASRCFLHHPNIDFFFPPSAKPLSDEELLELLEERGSSLMLLLLPAPSVVEDVLFPQLRKAEESVRALLEKNCFSLLRSDVGCVSGRAFLLFELEVSHLSRASRRVGPPVWEADHLSRFLEAHPKPLSGPYIRDGRAVVELCRSYTRPQDLLAAKIGGLSLGKHLSSAIREGHNILVGPEIASIKDEEFRAFLREYFEARNWIC